MKVGGTHDENGLKGLEFKYTTVNNVEAKEETGTVNSKT